MDDFAVVESVVIGGGGGAAGTFSPFTAKHNRHANKLRRIKLTSCWEKRVNKKLTMIDNNFRVLVHVHLDL